MPKKTRKMKQRAAERRSMQHQLGAGESASTPSAAPAPETTMRTRADFGASRAVAPIAYDYSHIYSDLRRIALFAGFFFVVLIVLSFVIK